MTVTSNLGQILECLHIFEGLSMRNKSHFLSLVKNDCFAFGLKSGIIGQRTCFFK